jgi:hypothetical protein
MYQNLTSTFVKCIQRDNAIVGKRTKLNDLLIHKNPKPQDILSWIKLKYKCIIPKMEDYNNYRKVSLFDIVSSLHLSMW